MRNRHLVRGSLFLALGIAIGACVLSMAFLNYSQPPSCDRMTKGAMQQLLVALHNYNARFDVMPQMDMPSVVVALSGGNPDKIALIDIQPRKVKWIFWTKTFPAIDAEMNILDAWGHPLKLDYDSRKQALTIHSLGKNGIDDGGKPDDLVLNHPFQ